MSNNTKSVTCHGRETIITAYTSVTRDNLFDVLAKALPIFEKNRNEIQYLDNYRKGITPILQRVKSVRPEITNKINVNFASNITGFKVGYLLNEPVQYVARSNDDKTVVETINILNSYMYEINKEYYDKELAESFSVGGVGYRFVKPTGSNEDIPFEVYDIKSDNAFVVRNGGLGNIPVLGVITILVYDPVIKGERIKYCCYSPEYYWEVMKGDDFYIEKEEINQLGMIPLIEYSNNSSRVGDFELVLPLLDAIDTITSNRIDGVEQFVQSLMKFINVDITSEDFEKLKDLGAIKIKSNGENRSDVEFITQELHQADVEVLLNSIFEDVLTICGMPNERGSNASTSDNVGATIVRQGWQGAESRAKTTELIFKKSEKEFLKIVLKILKTYKNIDLSLRDILIKLPRRNYENISQKATVLTTLLGSGQVHPKLAFESCGLFTDPQTAYLLSKQYADEVNRVKSVLDDEN